MIAASPPGCATCGEGACGEGGVGAAAYAGGMTALYAFEAELYRWASRREKWLFVSLPSEESAEIAELPAPPRGFESLRVDVTLGASTWRTSIFPGGDGRYTMPVKRSVYEKEGVDEGDAVSISLRLLDVG